MFCRWSGDALVSAAQPSRHTQKFLKLDRQQHALHQVLSAYLDYDFVQHTLLYGARGCGKTTLLANSLQNFTGQADCTAAWVAASQLPDIARIVEAALANKSRRHIIAIDDLRSEGARHGELEYLRMLLDPAAAPLGSLLVCATSNRRQIIEVSDKEVSNDLRRQSASEQDARLSLVDRFDMWLGFAAFSTEEYLDCCAEYWLDLQQNTPNWVPELKKQQLQNLRGLLGKDALDTSESLAWLSQRNQHPCGRAAVQFVRYKLGASLALLGKQ